ncbi:MAG: dienelactone hydrolase family protein [Alphaproteobacteria bacterium]|nr:dienelactone hydrolase family protein [Alphaproteobacteria bacterium]MBU2378181.1 dienelactone hydrolase family protein [Alphaproteobacteria bacterium]
MNIHTLSLAALIALGASTAATAQTSQVIEPAVCASDIAPAGTIEVVNFETRRRPIETVLIRPTGPTNGAAIVMLHGQGGLQSDLPRYELQAYQLASRGYYVVLPNYYSASNRSFRDSPLIAERWREVASDAVDYAATLPGVTADKVGIWGYSLGGRLAVDSTLDGGAARAVVAVATAGRLGDGRSTTPTLLIAGDQDPVATIVSVNRWADELRTRDMPVTVETLNTAKHLFDAPTWCEVFQHTRDFFDAQLLSTAR